MPESQILWTALPRGADAQHLELDVFVSPRLGLDAIKERYELSEFPDWEHWTKTLQNQLSFAVQLEDGTVHAAQLVSVESLEHAAWDGLFPSKSFVRPWSFKDLSDRPIYSFPLRFVTAYLRDRYREIGQAHPTSPPGIGGLGGLVKDLGPITDQRIPEERKPPPRDPSDLPLPEGVPGPTPPSERRGCIGFLWRLVLWLIRVIRLLLGLPPPPKPKPPEIDPTRPKTRVPRVVHPSPYGSPVPLEPVIPPALAALESEMAANLVAAPPQQQYGDMSTALLFRDPTDDFTRVLRFYERPESEPPKTGGLDPTKVPPRPEVPELDFHQALGALGDYPTIIRRLGLVVRLKIPRPVTAPASVRVLPAWSGQPRPTVDVSPRTLCSLDGNRFLAQAATVTDLEEGVLALTGASDALVTDTPRFDLIQVDADGAAIKAILTASSLERRRQLRLAKLYGYELPDVETLPALRSGGLAIARPDRAFWVHTHLVETATLKAPIPAGAGEPPTLPRDLHADDLVRGYRVEVSRDGGSTWSSLCSRVGNYRILGEDGSEVWTLDDFEDEGYVKAASTTSEQGDGNPLYLHEVLVRWTGWSLTAPLPGRTIGRTQDVEAPSRAAKTAFRLETRFKAQPGTLPRLRFRNSYRLRLLAIDLAGEPLAKARPDSPTSKDVKFRRFESAEAAALLPLREYLPGESLERLVLRSDFDTDAHAYETGVLGLAAGDAKAHRTRHVFPPKTSQLQAELHGGLDDAFGPNGHPDAGYRIALREEGTFRDEKVFDIHTVDVIHPQATIPFGTPVAIKPDVLPPPGEPQGQGTYVINREDGTLQVPYLPDPIVAGAALRGVPGLTTHVDGHPLDVVQIPDPTQPGGSAPVLKVPYTGSWPDLLAFRLRVRERTATSVAPHWDVTERALTVFLGKAELAEIRYSSYLASDDLDAHGVWDWISEDARPSLRDQALAGAHWMISPPRSLVAIHAVQRPLETAHFTTLSADGRKEGQTTAPLKGALHVHAASTGRIDVIGTWREWRDGLLDTTTPPTEKRESVAFDFVVDESWPDDGPFPRTGQELRALHEFGDTKHRTVHYKVRATTRFREYLPDGIIDPAGENLWRDSEPTEEFEVNVPSSARPEAPKVLYIVPTFAWRDTLTAGWTTVMQERRGGGLRVYLDRPWFSSGEGELLGVVLGGAEPTPPPDELRTRYGADATWGGAKEHVVATLMPDHFPNRATYEPSVQLAERSDVTATVVGFQPEYDRARRLWFCDIEVAVSGLPWNYWPFIRLALVRYQPNSLPEVKVSPVVVGEFAQLAPDRELSVVWQGNQKVRATLRGRGPNQPIGCRVAYLIQSADPAAAPVPDELDWEWAAGAPEIVDQDSYFTLVEPRDPAGDGELEWAAEVDLPFVRGTKPMRLAVREYELIRVDRELIREEGNFNRNERESARGIPRMSFVSAIRLD